MDFFRDLLLVGGFGPVTSTAEAMAVSVGAGILLGGFAVGVVGTIFGWESQDRDRIAIGAGYMAGLLVAVAACVEAIVR